MQSATHRSVIASNEGEFHRAGRSMSAVARPALVVLPAISLYLPIEQFVFVAGKSRRSFSQSNGNDVQAAPPTH